MKRPDRPGKDDLPFGLQAGLSPFKLVPVHLLFLYTGVVGSPKPEEERDSAGDPVMWWEWDRQ